MSDWNEADFLPLLLDHIGAGVVVLDRAYRVVSWNAFMAANSGLAFSQVQGRDLFEAFPDTQRKWLEKKIDSVFELGNYAFTSWEQRPWVFRFPHHRPITGGIDCMRQNCMFVPLRKTSSQVPDFVAILIHDATDAALDRMKLASVLEEVTRLSTIDGLTQIANRRHLMARLQAEIGRAARHGNELSVVMFDLDHFKRINDNHGHAGGDAVLREVARRVTSLLRGADVFGRYGGEEFAVALPETNLEGARIVAERIRTCIAAQPIAFGTTPIPATTSLGVAAWQGTDAAAEVLVAAADAALYRAKASGRNRVVVADGAVDLSDSAANAADPMFMTAVAAINERDAASPLPASIVGVRAA